jgi:hypothetical protein
MHSRTLGALAAVAVLAACGDAVSAPTGRSLQPTGTASLAKPGPTDPTATFAFPLADASLALRGDHLYSDGSSSVYANGVCGVGAKIFATAAASNSGDATMQTNSSPDHRCRDYPRTLTVVFSDSTEVSVVFMNLREIENTSYAIPIGSTVPRGLHVNETRCNGLVWQGTLGDGTVTGADSVLVTRVNATTWSIQTQPAPNDKAYCKNTGVLYHLPVQFTLVSSVPLP